MAKNIYKEGTSSVERIDDDVIFTQSVEGGVKNGFSIQVDRIMKSFEITPYINDSVAGGTLHWENDKIYYIQPNGFSIIVDTKNPNYLFLMGYYKGGKYSERGFYVCRDGSVHYLRSKGFGGFGKLNLPIFKNFFDLSRVKFDIVASKYEWDGEITSYRAHEDYYTMSYYARIAKQSRQYEGVTIEKITHHKVSYVSTKGVSGIKPVFKIEEDYSQAEFVLESGEKRIFKIELSDKYCSIYGANGENLIIKGDDSLKVLVANKNGKNVRPIQDEFPFTDELVNNSEEKANNSDEKEVSKGEKVFEEQNDQPKSPQDLFNEEYKSLEQRLKDLYKNFRYEAKFTKFNPSRKNDLPKLESLTVYKCEKLVGENLIIPHPTTSVKGRTFLNCDKSRVLTLTLCENIESIEAGVFSNFTALKKIEFNSPKIKTICKNTFGNTNLSTIYFPSGVKLIEKDACYGSENLLEIYVPSGCVVMDGAVPKHTAIFYYGNLTSEEKEKNKRSKKLVEKSAKQVKKSTQKPKKDKKSKNGSRFFGNLFSSIGRFFKTIGVFLLNVILFIPTKIGDFFKYGFKRKVGAFFKGVLKVLLFIPRCIAWPFIKGFSSVKKGFRGDSLIPFLTIVIGAFVLVAGHFGWLKVASDGVEKFFNAIAPTNWFGMHLCSGIAQLLDGLSDEAMLLALPLGVLFIPSVVLDLLWNLIVLILVLLNAVIYFIVGISLFYGAGVWICLPAGIMTAITWTDKYGKILPIFCLLLGIACTILYYLSFTSFYY